MTQDKRTLKSIIEEIEGKREYASELQDALGEVEHLPMVDKLLRDELQDIQLDLESLMSRTVTLGDPADMSTDF